MLLFWQQRAEVRLWFWRAWRSGGLWLAGYAPSLGVLIKMAAVVSDGEWAQADIRTQTEDTQTDPSTDRHLNPAAPEPGALKPNRFSSEGKNGSFMSLPSASFDVIDYCMIDTCHVAGSTGINQSNGDMFDFCEWMSDESVNLVTRRMNFMFSLNDSMKVIQVTAQISVQFTWNNTRISVC